MSKELTTKLSIEAVTKGADKLAAIAAELKKMADAGESASPAFATLADEFAQLSDEIAQASPELAGLTAEMQKLRTVTQDRDLLGVRAHADIQKEIEATRAAYERLKSSMTDAR